MNENNKIYKTIGEVAKILNLIDKKTGKLSTHTIRFWEKQFKQVKPNIFAGRRRYYDHKSIELLKTGPTLTINLSFKNISSGTL